MGTVFSPWNGYHCPSPRAQAYVNPAMLEAEKKSVWKWKQSMHFELLDLIYIELPRILFLSEVAWKMPKRKKQYY